MSELEILTKTQVIDLVRKKSRKHTSASTYADAIGVTRPQRSQALADKIPMPPGVLKDIGVTRVTLYVRGKVPTRFLDGSTEV